MGAEETCLEKIVGKNINTTQKKVDLAIYRVMCGKDTRSVAKSVGYGSPQALYSAFRKIKGQTMGEFLDSRGVKSLAKNRLYERIEHAKYLLRYNNSIEVSGILGYNYPQQFYGDFKKVTGMTTQEWVSLDQKETKIYN